MPHPDDHDDLGAYDFYDADESGDDSDDDSDALDFPDAEDVNGDQSAISDIDALDNDYAPDGPATEDAGTALEAIDLVTEVAEEEVQGEEEEGVQLFSVVNPSNSVMVSALMDGRTERVKLSPKAIRQTEAELVQEIIVLAELARLKGLAGQHTYLLENASQSEGLQELGALGLDGKEVLRTFMETGMQLPTPEQASEAQAEVFATRYRQDDD
ncbi:hypothetical protein ACX9NE_14130 [Mycobacterium sp. ML4]